MKNLHFLIQKIKVFLHESKIRLKFEESCLKQDNKPFTPNKVVDLFVVNELDTWSGDLNTDFTV